MIKIKEPFSLLYGSKKRRFIEDTNGFQVKTEFCSSRNLTKVAANWSESYQVIWENKWFPSEVNPCSIALNLLIK